MDRTEKIDLAMHAAKNLFDMHREFMAELNKTENQKEYAAGALQASADEVKLSSMGVVMLLRHKIVCIEQYPQLVEYRFITDYEDEELVILKFYLQPNYILTMEIDPDTKLCDYNNSYLGKILVYEVAEKLLNSPIFEQTKV